MSQLCIWRCILAGATQKQALCKWGQNVTPELGSLNSSKSETTVFFLNAEDTCCFSKYSLLPKASSLKRSVKLHFVWQISVTLKIPEILLCIAQELEHSVSQEPLVWNICTGMCTSFPPSLLTAAERIWNCRDKWSCGDGLMYPCHTHLVSPKDFCPPLHCAQQKYPLGGDIWNSSNDFTNHYTTSSFTGFLLKSDEKLSKHIKEQLDSENYHTWNSKEIINTRYIIHSFSKNTDVSLPCTPVHLHGFFHNLTFWSGSKS